jgi:predicted RNase H-like nuclease (RuvC/YqgF family)
MTNFDAVVAGIIAIITALSGAGFFAAFKKLAEAAKVRAEGKKISEDGHAKTQQLLEDLKAGQADTIARLQAENEQLRAENESLKNRVKRLENENARLIAALPQRAAAKEKKD